MTNELQIAIARGIELGRLAMYFWMLGRIWTLSADDITR